MLRRGRKAFGCAVLCCLLPACGAMLGVRSTRIPLLAEAATAPAEIEVQWRPATNNDADTSIAGGLFLFAFTEPLDWVLAALSPIALVLDPQSIAGGPFGVVAALTPFATLLPAPYGVCPINRYTMDRAHGLPAADVELLALRDGDRATRLATLRAMLIRNELASGIEDDPSTVLQHVELRDVKLVTAERKP